MKQATDAPQFGELAFNRVAEIVASPESSQYLSRMMATTRDVWLGAAQGKYNEPARFFAPFFTNEIKRLTPHESAPGRNSFNVGLVQQGLGLAAMSRLMQLAIFRGCDFDVTDSEGRLQLLPEAMPLPSEGEDALVSPYRLHINPDFFTPNLRPYVRNWSPIPQIRLNVWIGEQELPQVGTLERVIRQGHSLMPSMVTLEPWLLSTEFPALAD